MTEKKEELHRSFALKFDIKGTNIKTAMNTLHVSPQEALGLLEMAKDQILDNVKKGRKDIFSAHRKE